MAQVEDAPTPQECCANCGRMSPSYNIVSFGSVETGYRELCYGCYNAEFAELDGLDKFQHFNFEPVEIADFAGAVHVFYFRTRLFGPGVALDAFELRDGFPAGYQFQAIGEPEGDLLALLGRLIERMRRALSIQHVRDGELGLEIADHQVVRGTIGWDEASVNRMPLLIIDGREITWEEFGRMWMTFEGSQFKLEIRDKSEEV